MFIYLINKFFRSRHLVFLSILTFQIILYSQSTLASDQCSPTPSFPKGTLNTLCPTENEPVLLFSENFDEGYRQLFGSFIEVPVVNNRTFLLPSTGGKSNTLETGARITASCDGSSNIGEFVYLESGLSKQGENHCISRSINLTRATAPLSLSLWYHMYGVSTGELSVKINGANGFSIAGQQQTSSFQDWKQAIVNLDSYVGRQVEVQICMNKGDNSDFSFRGDIAVDQFEIYSCEALKPLQSDILDFVPSIIAGINREPPPPSTSRWRITNLVACPSFFSEWTVSDGTTARQSVVRSSIIVDSNTSGYVTVEPGKSTFRWSLRTTVANNSCGSFADSFTRDLKPGFDYEFVLETNGANLTVDTIESR